MPKESTVVGVDLKSRSLEADLLDCISGFSLFVDELRADGTHKNATTPLVDDLVRLFRKADEGKEDLRLLGAFVPDLLYIRISELQMMDQWAQVYTRMLPHLLLDQLRVRGICSFYILDNEIRKDRFDALVKVFGDAGFFVISPNLDGAGEAELVERVDYAQVLRNHILYVEKVGELAYIVLESPRVG